MSLSEYSRRFPDVRDGATSPSRSYFRKRLRMHFHQSSGYTNNEERFGKSGSHQEASSKRRQSE